MTSPSRTPPKTLAVHVFTVQGLELAQKLTDAFEVILYATESLKDYCSTGFRGELIFFSSIREDMQECFARHDAHLFIGATGIAVRAIAPFIVSKAADPAVLVSDHTGKHVISLLSGHQGKGNALTRLVAAELGAVPVITTATDLEALPAVDELAVDHGMTLVNPGAVKLVSGALLRGENPLLADPRDLLELQKSDQDALFISISAEEIRSGQPGPSVLVSERASHGLELPRDCLLLRPKSVFAGIGCKRGAREADILDAIAQALEQADIAPECLAGVASFEAKRDEPGLLVAAESLHVPIHFFTAEELALFPSAISPKAMETFHIPGVCEPAALAAVAAQGATPRLLAEKNVFHSITVALAVADGSR